MIRSMSPGRGIRNIFTDLMDMHVKTIISFLLFLVAIGAQAQTLYVTDEFKVTMRSGESAKHRVVQMVKSGTPVTLLGKNKETGYSHVRTSSGKTGYILWALLYPIGLGSVCAWLGYHIFKRSDLP